MKVPEKGEGAYRCKKCQFTIFSPIKQGGRIVKVGALFNKPKCPSCGCRSFKRDEKYCY